MPGRPLRILHIVHSLGYGGMESRIARLARGLPKDSHAVEVLSFKPAAGGQVDLGPGVPHHPFPMPDGLHPLRLLRLVAAVRRGRYDIVHTHNWSSMFYGIVAACLARVPVVVHGEHGLNRSDLAGIPWKRLWAQRLLARLADWLVPVNGVIAAHVKSAWKLDDSRLTVIPNGVDLARFAPAGDRTAVTEPIPAVPAADPGRTGEFTRAELSIPAGGFVLGMVGRLDDVKDIGCALRALRLLDERGAGTGLRLVLVGEGPMRSVLEAQAASLGVLDRVEFAGARRDVEAWYGRFDLYLNTSVYEGMSNTLLEAMACGLPVVASRVPGNAAWLVEGENALFFPPGDAEALADAIAGLRADAGRRRDLGRRNRQRVETEFDNRQFLASYIRLYQTLTGPRPRG